MKSKSLLIVLMLLLTINFVAAEDIEIPISTKVNVTVEGMSCKVVTETSSLIVANITNTTSSFNTLDIDLIAKTSILNGSDVREVLKSCMDNLSDSEYKRGVQKETNDRINIDKVNCLDNWSHYEKLYVSSSGELRNKTTDLNVCTAVKKKEKEEHTLCKEDLERISNHWWRWLLTGAGAVLVYFWGKRKLNEPKGPKRQFPETDVETKPPISQEKVKEFSKKLKDKADELFKLGKKGEEGAKPPV